MRVGRCGLQIVFKSEDVYMETYEQSAFGGDAAASMIQIIYASGTYSRSRRPAIV